MRKITVFWNMTHVHNFVDYLIAKYLLFDFVNFYGIIIYIALGEVWIQRYKSYVFGIPSLQGYCVFENCMLEVTMQMTVIFIARSAAYHFWNYMEPYVTQGIEAYKRGELHSILGFCKEIRQREADMLARCHSEYFPQIYADVNLTTPEDKNSVQDGYNSSTVQFGFVVFFSLALPVAPLLAMFHNIVQRKIGKEFEEVKSRCH